MKSYEQLVEGESFWPAIKSWVSSADLTVEVLRKSPSAERELVALQVMTHSALGAVVFESGGTLVDHRWLRILGSGLRGKSPSIGDWNGVFAADREGLIVGTLVFAWDAIGGIFTINGDRLPFRKGNVCYFSPESLEWLDTQMGYSEFLSWSFSENLCRFYQHLRWPNWAAEVSALSADHGLSLYPPQFSREGKRIEEVSHRSVPAIDLLRLQIHFGREIGGFNI